MARIPRKPSAGLSTQHAPPLGLPLRFVVTGLGMLLLLALVYPWHVPLLLGSFYSPHLLTFVHVNTLGFIGAIILGASFQLLPVVLQVPLASVRLAWHSWWLYLAGVLAFLVGLSEGQPLALGIGGSLLYLGLALYVGIVAVTLARAPHRDVIYWHVAAAVAGLAMAATLGLLLALSKFSGLLGGTTFPILGAHVTLMLGGWVTPMLTGVAYRLVGMFTLSEDRLREDWAAAALALNVSGAWILAAGLLFGLGRWVELLGSVGLLAGIGVFGVQLVRLYRLRRRRTFDVHIPFALSATAFGLLSAGLAVAGLALQAPASDPLWVAAVWLAIAGWAETAMQGFLYKIGTFLTWLHRYAPLAGRQAVPRLEDLFGQRTALVGWGCWTLGVALAAVAALSRAEWLATPASLGLSAGAGAFLWNAARVGAHWRRAQTGAGAVSTPGPALR